METSLTSFINSLNILESLAVLLSIAYVIFAAKENIFAWYCAFFSVSIYIYLCLKAHLYAETFLQIFYLIMAVVGWYQWRFKKEVSESKKKIKQLPVLKHLINILLSSIATIITGYLLSKYTQAALPYVDAFTTIFSLYATWMVTEKILENWLYWIVIDIVSFFLYTSRELYLTGLLYIVFTLLAIFGYLKWKKSYKAQHA
jgi:nicotinamide mononucleotide transporter